jgi:protoporphyrinogen oxidase
LVVVGAGPAGLAAAHEATRHGASTLVIEGADRVGGLARTIERDGHRYDIGPHRFLTSNAEVRQLYIDVVADDLVTVARRTRILCSGRYFDYPLTPFNALGGLGVANSVAALASYAGARSRARFAPTPIATFEDWIVDRFGRRIYHQFFQSYTEKVWGIPCTRIGADWAAQRIRGLSLARAIGHALRRSKTPAKTLADEFLYPRLGAGQFYDKLAARVVARGAALALRTRATRIEHRDGIVTGLRAASVDGERTIRGNAYLCSAPLTDLVAMMDPPPPPDVLAAARALRYRTHIAVQLDVQALPFADQWIYVHASEVHAARIANYRNFSPAMARAPDASPLTVEYFCDPGDALAARSDSALVALATDELARLRIVDAGMVRGGFVVRSPNAYPVIELGCDEHVARIRRWLSGFTNLLPIGRSGMFKYNNQDHAIATGLLAARTALAMGQFDPWNVNIDGVYLEGAPVPDRR